VYVVVVFVVVNVEENAAKRRIGIVVNKNTVLLLNVRRCPSYFGPRFVG
jgi:hypothetical protein